MFTQACNGSKVTGTSIQPTINTKLIFRIKHYEILHIEYVATQSFKKHFNCMFGIARFGLF